MLMVIRFRRGDVEDELFIPFDSVPEGESLVETLRSLEGAEVVSVCTKQTREELKSNWRFLVQTRGLECSFVQWIETGYGPSSPDRA